MHKRNKHKGRYDLEVLSEAVPELSDFIFVNDHGIESIDFFDPDAVLALNKALLIHHYGIKHWGIPEGFLCPPIPGRADYVHYLADLLPESVRSKGGKIKVLDIGTGANCIYPIIGHQTYGWSFVGSEADEAAYLNAKSIVEKNPDQLTGIEIRRQINPNLFYQGIIKKDEIFDLSMCNPPFYSSAKEAKAANRKKFKSLNPKSTRKKNMNFGGQGNELWTAGGEETFIHNMIHESRNFSTSCYWFSTLVSKEAILQSVYKAFRRAKVSEYKMVEMTQGNKKSRFVAWTFLDAKQRKIWEETRW
jgi:23S rRNA (adenine1618-N6)-methyltransferase